MWVSRKKYMKVLGTFVGHFRWALLLGEIFGLQDDDSAELHGFSGGVVVWKATPTKTMVILIRSSQSKGYKW
jgi:hypothetical protein